MSAKSITSIDQMIAGRLRLLRQIEGLSQETLAKRVGVSFQQLQKYERGVNRISASRLYLIAQELGVEITHFFEDEESDQELTRRTAKGRPAMRD